MCASRYHLPRISTNPVSEKHILGICLGISSCLYNSFYSTCSEGSPKARLYWHDFPTCCCSMRFTYCKGSSSIRFAEAAGNWKTWRIPVFWDTKRRHRVISFPTFRGNAVFTLNSRLVPEQRAFFWEFRPLTMKTLRYLYKSGSHCARAQRHMPEEGNPRVHRCQNLRTWRALSCAMSCADFFGLQDNTVDVSWSVASPTRSRITTAVRIFCK